MAAEDQERKIISDEDWKSQARREKERLAAEKAEAAAQAEGGAASGRTSAARQPRGPLPPANFLTLVNSLALQTLLFLGRLGPQEKGKEPEVNLDMAKHNIDMLSMLEEKTRGNLTDEERTALATTLHELRLQYVAAARI